MRLRPILGVFVLFVVIFAMTETDGRAQFGFGGFDMKNPESMFSAYASRQGNKDYLEIEKVQSRLDPDLPNKMKAYAERVGIRDGKLTKTQFADFWTKDALPNLEERMKQRTNIFGGFGKSPSSPPTPPTPPAPAAPASVKSTSNTTEKARDQPPPQPTGFQPRPFDEGEAKRYFERMDENNSKTLEDYEYRRSEIRRQMDKWDANKNNIVEETEWLAYMKGRHDEREEERRVREEERRLFEEFKAARKAQERILPIGPLMPDKPVVIRADNLPEELPSWFKELNTDGDAQVSLVEWRAGEKDNDEFRKHDRNSDGLLTPHEVLWYTENADRLAGIKATGPTGPTGPTAPEKGKTTWGGFRKSGPTAAPMRP